MAIKDKPIDELMALCEGEGQSVPVSLEAEAKRRLRSVRGKAADLVPYLLHAATVESGKNVRIPSTKSMTLGKAIEFATDLLGDRAATAVDSAIKAYVKAHDVSYHLKQA